ncbi:MAG TPA: hypothetical protein PLC38_09150 [Methanobacterium sp.]|nr:MAG: hypothetical protein FGO69_00145 [Methanobacterium sp.]HOI72428.1 hypothetical protein [Methanobacterium sp.]
MQGGIVFGSCCIGIFIIVGIFGMMSADSNSNTQTQATAPTATESTPTVDTTSNQPTLSEEESYRQWVKEDYKRWENAMGSSYQLYQLYQGAQAKKPPEKYKEFHKHYIKSYYYYYLAAKAAENNNIPDVEYYTDLAFAEDEQLGVYMPDYAQLTAS